MSLIQQLHDILKDSHRDFFPDPFTIMLEPTGPFPLLQILNNSSVSSPTVPLTITAIKQLARSAGMEQLTALNKQLLDFMQSGKLEDLGTIFNDITDLEEQTVHLLTDQVIIGLSLLSIIKALKPTSLEPLATAHSEYFFGHPTDPKNPAKGTLPGYVTIAGEVIAPPALPSFESASDLRDIARLFSRKTGEQYVRDLTRVGFEAVANDVWKLESRYDQMTTNAKLQTGNLEIKDLKKAQNWFKGFADYAEAGVTSAVEQALSQSGGPVPANPLLAAGLATAAGTAARKASQHVFLEQIGIVA